MKKRVYIIAAALRLTSKKGYQIIWGRDHASCFLKDPKWRKRGVEQGFLTSERDFVNRTKAAAIAFEAGQVGPEVMDGVLVSEDIWLNGKWDWNEEKGRYYKIKETNNGA